MPPAARATKCVGKGIGSSRPAKVAPAPPAHRDSTDEIRVISQRIVDDMRVLNMLMKEKKRKTVARSVERSRSRSEKSRAARSSQRTQLSDKLRAAQINEVPEEDGGALSLSKTGKKLTAYQLFVKRSMVGVPHGELQSRMKAIAAQWRQQKAAGVAAARSGS